MPLLGTLLDQVNVNFCCCINDGVLNNVFRRLLGWVDFAGKLQPVTGAHQCEMWVVLVFEVTDDVDGRLSFTGEDTNRLGLPRAIARHDLDKSKGGNKKLTTD